MERDEHRDYAVGYGKPPKHSQFRKGVSGNPNGRPKGAKSTRASLERAINEPVTVVIDGKRQKLSKLEAAFVQQANKAAKGDAKAVQLLLTWSEKYGLGPSLREMQSLDNDPRTAEEVRNALDAKLARLADNMEKNQGVALRNGPNNRSDANPDGRKGDDEIADTSER